MRFWSVLLSLELSKSNQKSFSQLRSQWFAARPLRAGPHLIHPQKKTQNGCQFTLLPSSPSMSSRDLLIHHTCQNKHVWMTIKVVNQSLGFRGTSNQWRPGNQARIGFDYWKAVNANDPNRSWWTEIWNGLYWQSSNEFTDRYDSVIFANSVRAGVRHPSSGIVSVFTPYVAVQSSRTKYDYGGQSTDFYWENGLLAGGGLRFAPSITDSMGHLRWGLNRLVVYGETSILRHTTASPHHLRCQDMMCVLVSVQVSALVQAENTENWAASNECAIHFEQSNPGVGSETVCRFPNKPESEFATSAPRGGSRIVVVKTTRPTDLSSQSFGKKPSAPKCTESKIMMCPLHPVRIRVAARDRAHKQVAVRVFSPTDRRLYETRSPAQPMSDNDDL